MIARVTVAAIQAAVAQDFGIPLREMTSARRARNVARPRQIAMTLACELTGQSLVAIGKRFGHRDHTTVAHARKAIGALRLIETDLDRRIRALANRIAPPPAEAHQEVQLEFLIGPLFDHAGMIGAAS